MFTEVEKVGVKYSHPKGNAMDNLSERIADTLLLLGGHSGLFVPQNALRFWLGGKWSSHRVHTMEKLVEMGWVTMRRVGQRNWFTLTALCYQMLLDRKEECKRFGSYSEGLRSEFQQKELL